MEGHRFGVFLKTPSSEERDYVKKQFEYFKKKCEEQ